MLVPYINCFNSITISYSDKKSPGSFCWRSNLAFSLLKANQDCFIYSKDSRRRSCLKIKRRH